MHVSDLSSLNHVCTWLLRKQGANARTCKKLHLQGPRNDDQRQNAVISRVMRHPLMNAMV